MAVASTTQSDSRSGFSNYGPGLTIAAPGSGIYSTLPGGYGFKNGTSMSTPFVAGAAALVWAANPGWSAGQVRDRLVQTGDPLNVPEFNGARRLNVGAALSGGIAPTVTTRRAATSTGPAAPPSSHLASRSSRRQAPNMPTGIRP